MSKYALARNALEEEYGDLLIRIALKEYMKEQARLLEEEEAMTQPTPQPKNNVVAAAFRQVGREDAKDTVLHGLKKGFTRVAVVFLAAAITFTTAFAASPGVRGAVKKLLFKPVERGNLVPAIEVPNDSVQMAMDRWMDLGFGMMGIDREQPTVQIIRSYCQACRAQGAEPVTRESEGKTWLDAALVEAFAKETFGIEPETLRAAAAAWNPVGYREDAGYLIPEITASAEKIILLDYIPLTDTAFQMEIGIRYAADRPFEVPLMVTVDMSSGTPVFTRAEPANDLYMYAENDEQSGIG